MEERGIILTHQMSLDTNKNTLSFGNSEGALTRSELRKHLLYWDFVDFPRTSFMNIELGNTEEKKLLIDQGFIKQTDIYSKNNQAQGNSITFDINKICEAAIIGQLDTVKEYANKNIRCAISQYNVDPKVINLYIPKSNKEVKKVIEFELINCLPYPSTETEIADILEFKDRRKDELIELRLAIDVLNDLASREPEALKEKKSLRELEERISAVNKLLKERKINILTTPTKILVDISKEIIKDRKSIFFDMALTTALGFSITSKEFIAVNGTRAIINATAKNIFGPKELPDNVKDFAYLYYAQKELK